ncbi:MAG TPA: Lcl domain-containing protein [Xylella sp.]
MGEYTNELNNSEAEKACRELTLGGHTDWRLPTVNELLTLGYYSPFKHVINTHNFQYLL